MLVSLFLFNKSDVIIYPYLGRSVLLRLDIESDREVMCDRKFYKL